MAQIVKELRVDVSQPNVFQAIVAKQHDSNSRFLKITLVDFGVKVEVPNTAKVTINANRPDGASESFKGEANNDGTITVPLAQWMLDIDGEVKCDVSVTNTEDNKRLTSTDFWLEVQKAANPNASIPLDPDGEILIIKPVTEINENSKDTDYPSAKAVYDYGQNIVTDTQITATATGSAITLESSQAPLQNLKLYGKTEQDGTPTPDNPIELKSVGDSGSFEVGVYGRNLFDINGNVNLWGHNGENAGKNTVDGNILKAGVDASTSHSIGQKIKIGMDNTITFSAKLLSYGSGYGAQLAIYDGKNTPQSLYIGANGINQTYKITYTAKGEYLIFCFATFGGVGAEFTDIQVEFGTQATPFEPFNKQSITFTDTLRGVGDIADEKDFARGVQTQRFEKVVYDGSSDEKWSYHDAPTFPLGKYALVPLPKPTKYNTKTYTTNTLCDRFKNVENVVNAYVDGVVSLSKYAMGIVKNEFSDENSVREWLQANPITVIYELETPIETPISEQELNAYRQLYTNKGNTTILNSDGADMEISYYINKPNAQAIGNIHSQINKDYFKLQQAIISTGGNV
jgi:hypothetical protein